MSRLRARPVLWALALALAVRLGYLAVATVGQQFPSHRVFECETRPYPGATFGNTPDLAIDVWTRGDGCHYLGVARHGYQPLPDSTSAAFFPLYPLLLRGTVWLTGMGDLVAGIVLSNVLGFIAWALLALLAARRLEAPQAALALALFAAFPTRNFEMSINTESLFLLLSVGAFLGYEQRRDGVVALAAALAAATRPQGMLVGGALLADALITRFAPRLWARHDTPPAAPRPAAATAALCLFPAGLVAFMSHLAATVGDPLAFVAAQKVWRRSLTDPITTLLSGNDGPQAYLAVFAALAVLVVMMRRRAPLRDVLYVGASLAIPLTSGSMYSFARFVGVLFPVFFAGAELLASRPRSRAAYWLVAGGLAVWTAYRVGHGGAVV